MYRIFGDFYPASVSGTRCFNVGGDPGWDWNAFLHFDRVGGLYRLRAVDPFARIYLPLAAWDTPTGGDLDGWFGALCAGDHAATGPLVDWLLENAPDDFRAGLEKALAVLNRAEASRALA